MADSTMKESVAVFLKGIDRYNPENLSSLEHYVQMQAIENTYNLDANLAILKLYQFNPSLFKETVTCQILLKALMNLPQTDFTLCRCLISENFHELPSISKVTELSNKLEMCEFREFWRELEESKELIGGIKGFEESIKKFIVSVLNVTFQLIDKVQLTEMLGNLSDEDLKRMCLEQQWQITGDQVFIANQEEHIKSKNITEKITFENMSHIIRSST
ncbi:eukaryotic translation initiation factor 3 subunit K-like [Rhopilema esculentum]|uniref:eukaryotic translation initiation factor 3 subunit K-like n=1 Tax=Rhopilema esculentum TaxID=499914 RepID=UPI0031D70120